MIQIINSGFALPIYLFVESTQINSFKFRNQICIRKKKVLQLKKYIGIYAANCIDWGNVSV